MSRITNETLAALMSLHHEETSKRLDKIDEKQAITNGRLGKAESAIAVLEDARRSAGGTGPDGLVSVSFSKKWLTMAAIVGTFVGAMLLKMVQVWQAAH